jgi:flavodoxin
MTSKKKLVAYYSRTGKNKKIAHAIAKRLKADIDEIISLKDYSGPIGWLKAGKDSFKGKEVKIRYSKDPLKYDLVIIGGPAWAGVLAAPVYNYIKKNKFKKTAFFCVSGSGQPQKIPRQVKDLDLESPLLSLKESAVNRGDYIKEIDRFCESLK